MNGLHEQSLGPGHTLAGVLQLVVEGWRLEESQVAHRRRLRHDAGVQIVAEPINLAPHDDLLNIAGPVAHQMDEREHDHHQQGHGRLVSDEGLHQELGSPGICRRRQRVNQIDHQQRRRPTRRGSDDQPEAAR